MIRDLARTGIVETLRRAPVTTYQPEPRTVWLLRPDHLGDLLFLRPGLARFRRVMPDWNITVAVGPWSRVMIDDVSDIDQIVEVPFPGFTRSSAGDPLDPYKTLRGQAKQLRAARPAAVVLLRDDHWWGALLARIAGVPVIIGASRPEMRGLVTDAVDLTHEHAVEQNIEILDFSARRLGEPVDQGAPSPPSDPLTWPVTNGERDRARALLASAGVRAPFVAIHPGSGAPVKLWPARRWACVTGALADHGYDVVLTGSESEVPLLRQIATAANVSLPSLGGQTSIHELAALFDEAALVAGVDSGPLHLAVAVGTPTVHIYGPSDVARYGPWGDERQHRVVSAGLRCPACGDLSPSRAEGAGCMTAVGETAVIEAIRGLLER